MLRIALTRVAARSAVRLTISLRAARPVIGYVRFESTKAKDPRRQAIEARDDLQRDWDARAISYEELKPRTIQPTENAYLIDVRERDEVVQGAIPSAVNVPLSELPSALTLRSSDWSKRYGFEKPQPDQEIIFYCRSGKRSATACDVAKRNGYKNLINYTGSWLDWTERERGSSTPSA